MTRAERDEYVESEKRLGAPLDAVLWADRVVKAAASYIDEIDNGIVSGTYDRRLRLTHELRDALEGK